MRVLVCGSRDYQNTDRIYTVLGGLYVNYTAMGGMEFVIVEGGAAGADRIAQQWARYVIDQTNNFGQVKLETYPADWRQYGKSAGYLRNVQMLEEGKPHLVCAFFSSQERSRGTAMMVNLARVAGVDVWEHF